ncbi:DUF6531 domain-containing protein, partial [Tenacibaculum sp.]|uniref:DUF6531 domain-containing protein n=1 Tax=Tenacibaculum sp. TaxID=1906242 RepID=UPI003AA7FD97
MGEEKETSYYDKVSSNLKATIGSDAEKLSNSSQEINNVTANENLSTSTKAASVTLNAAEAGVQAFGAVTGAIDNTIEGAILPALGALGMKGIATLPISKQMDPVMGIDIHFVTIPPSPAPIPMPHPYIGMLFRAKDFVSAAIASFIPPPPSPPEVANPDAPTDDEQKALNMNKAANVGHMVATMAVGMLGATVKVGGVQPRAVAGTPTKSIPHIPIGAGFYPATAATIQKNIGHAFMGSFFTLADGDPLCGGTAHLHLNCNDVGIPSPHDVRPSKNTAKDYNPLINLYLPTGVVNPIPPSRAILTNPVPTPMNPVTAIKQLFKASLGKYLSKKMHNKVNASKKIKSDKLKNMLHKGICTVTGHPVDVAKGNFFTDEEDFYIGGIIPISWERTYYSNSDYKGPLGYGWHHQYDIALHIDEQKGVLSLRMNDGRPIAFNFPRLEVPEYNRTEQLEAQLTEDGNYRIWNEKESVYYYFTKETFDEVHLLSSIVDKNGFGLLFEYNNKGHLIQIKDSSHRVLTVENDAEGRIVEIIAPHPTVPNKSFAIAEYEYDNVGNMIRQTNAEGASMYFEYQNHLMVKETWRNGLNWFFKYDGSQTGARCIHTWGDKDIYNHKLEFFDGLTRVENSLGHVTEYYHKGGLVYERIDPNEAKHTWHYNEYNELLSETDPEGNNYIYDYDKRGNRTQMVDPDGGTIATTYDYYHPNQPSEIVDALGGKWGRIYNTQGNLVKSKNPKGATTKLKWQDGLLQSITDALNNNTELVYDDAYNLTEIISVTGTRTKFEFDALGRNTKIINAKGAEQRLTYDLLGRVVEVNDFDGNHIQLSYDGIDNLIEYKDKQQTVKYTYSGMWKLTSRSDARGTTFYTYDTEEQLTQILNEKNVPYIFKLNEVGEVLEERSFDQSTTQYKRDKAGRVVEKRGNDHKVTKYTYTRGGQVSEITYHDGTVHSFDYNPAGQLIEATNSDAEVTLTRDVLGQITQETVNGESITHEYNALGQRIGLQSSLGAAMNFEFDALGQLLKH